MKSFNIPNCCVPFSFGGLIFLKEWTAWFFWSLLFFIFSEFQEAFFSQFLVLSLTFDRGRDNGGQSDDQAEQREEVDEEAIDDHGDVHPLLGRLFALGIVRGLLGEVRHSARDLRDVHLDHVPIGGRWCRIAVKWIPVAVIVFKDRIQNTSIVVVTLFAVRGVRWRCLGVIIVSFVNRNSRNPEVLGHDAEDEAAGGQGSPLAVARVVEVDCDYASHCHQSDDHDDCGVVLSYKFDITMTKNTSTTTCTVMAVCRILLKTKLSSLQWLRKKAAMQNEKYEMKKWKHSLIELICSADFACLFCIS